MSRRNALTTSRASHGKMRVQVLALAVWLAWFVPSGAQLPDRPLVWAADAEGGAPYVFRDPDNPDAVIGFEKEIADALARELGRPIHFKQYDFDSLTLGLQKRGEFDFAMCGLEVTRDRREDPNLRFSRPYYAFKLQLVFRADDDLRHTLKDCKSTPGTIVGTLANTAASRLLEARGFRQGVDLKIFSSVVTAYEELEQGGVHAVLMDLPIAQYYADPQHRPKLRWAHKPLGGRGYYAIAFRAEDRALADAVDAALERLHRNGELRRILLRWGLWNDNQEEFEPDGEFRDIGEEETAIDTQAKRDWRFSAYFPLLLAGAGQTVKITLLSFLLAMVVALPVSLGRLYGSAAVRFLAGCYVEFFRGIPVLLLLYFLYYGLPAMFHTLGYEVHLHPELVAVLGLGLTYAAYEAEIYRAGILSIPEGQWEAAASLGMGPGLTFRRIILPQAVRVILPPSTSDLVALFKDTSIISVITIVELSKQYQILATAGADYMSIAEIGLVTAALYLVMSVPLGYLSRHLEKRWGRGPAV